MLIYSINQSFQYTFGNSSGAGGVVNGSAPSRSYNPDIKWEKNEQFDIGFDGSVFKGRLNFSVDFYQRRSKDLILMWLHHWFQELLNLCLSIPVLCRTGVSILH